VPETGKTGTQGQLLYVRTQLPERSTLYICIYFQQQTSVLLSQREEQDEEIELTFSVLCKQDISTDSYKQWIFASKNIFTLF